MNTFKLLLSIILRGEEKNVNNLNIPEESTSSHSILQVCPPIVRKCRAYIFSVQKYISAN